MKNLIILLLCAMALNMQAQTGDTLKLPTPTTPENVVKPDIKGADVNDADVAMSDLQQLLETNERAGKNIRRGSTFMIFGMTGIIITGAATAALFWRGYGTNGLITLGAGSATSFALGYTGVIYLRKGGNKMATASSKFKYPY